MKRAATIAQIVVRIAGLLMIILGIVIWTGNDNVIPVHVAVGVVLVLSLWTLAYLGLQSGASKGVVALAFVWGLIMPLLGLTQENILPEDGHLIIQVLHVLIGLGAIGQAENLAARVKRSGLTSETAS